MHGLKAIEGGEAPLQAGARRHRHVAQQRAAGRHRQAQRQHPERRQLHHRAVPAEQALQLVRVGALERQPRQLAPAVKHRVGSGGRIRRQNCCPRGPSVCRWHCAVKLCRCGSYWLRLHFNSCLCCSF